MSGRTHALRVVRPSAPLHHARAANGEVTFLAAGWPGPTGSRWSSTESEYYPFDEFACRVTSGGVRHAGVVRAVINYNSGASGISRGLAQLLGLPVQDLGGSGAQSRMGGACFAVSILTEPLTVELLQTDGRTALTLEAPLLFVLDIEMDVFELQLGGDICRRYGLGRAFGPEGTCVAQDDVPISMAPHLFPRRCSTTEDMSLSFDVVGDTYRHALDVVAARAAVRARRTAAEAGVDPRAAGEQAAAQALARQRDQPAEASGRGAPPRPARQGPEPGSAEWVQDWLPPQWRQGASGGGRRGRGGRRRGRGSRSVAAAAGARAADDDGDEDEDEEGARDAGRAPLADGSAATAGSSVQGPTQAPAADPASGLPSLPAALQAQAWAAVEATHLPRGEADCVVCLEALAAPGQLVAQLSCRHTYHVLCVRQLLGNQSGPSCPMCREPLMG